MRLTIHSATAAAIGLLLSLSLCGCSADSGVDGPVEVQFWDIATFDGPDPTAPGVNTYTFRQVDDSAPVTLTTSQAAPEGINPSDRVLIRYIPESGEAYRSGAARILSAARINQGPVATEWKDDYNDWDRDGVYLYSVWRTGSYLNFHVRLTYSEEPRIFTLAADPATLGSDYPDVYLVHKLAAPTDYHDRAYYASFSIASLWDNPSVKGITLHVANTNLPRREFTFLKIF